MAEKGLEVNGRIAARVLELRLASGLSLDALAARSGVSRSMISLVERGESSPTAVVLEKLATGLGQTLGALFEAPAAGQTRAMPGPLVRRAEQADWKDPASGYMRRNVSPPGMSQRVQIVEVHFPAGARVAFETGTREPRVHQQVWMLAGTMEITWGRERHRLREGDCLAMPLDRPTMFHNPTGKRARYAVVIAAEPGARR